MESLKQLYEAYTVCFPQADEPECKEYSKKAHELLGEDSNGTITGIGVSYEMQGFIRGFKLATQIMADCMGE